MEIQVVVSTFRNFGINEDLYFRLRKGTIRTAPRSTGILRSGGDGAL